MNGKEIGIALFFLLTGAVTLSLNFLFSLNYIFYFSVIFAFILLLAGLSVISTSIARSYEVQETSLQHDYQLLKQEIHFYLLEFTKVVTVALLSFEYPLPVFLLFVAIDCLDGWCLPYKKRTLTLRHKIDKFTDLICQTVFFLTALQVWVDVPILWGFWTLFYVLLIIKTASFLQTGNRNILLYIPNLFLTMYPATLILWTFSTPAFNFIFDTPLNVVIFIAIMLISSSLYEVLYNGVFSHFRYRRITEQEAVP
ncbi:MAG: hypothetical protein ACTSRL_11425 [Candidatus Helarchaeota archaeon]